MKSKLLQMAITSLKSEVIAEIAVQILWELAKLSENTLDDKIVEAVANALDVKI